MQIKYLRYTCNAHNYNNGEYDNIGEQQLGQYTYDCTKIFTIYRYFVFFLYIDCILHMNKTQTTVNIATSYRVIYVIPVVTWPRTLSGQTFQKMSARVQQVHLASKKKGNCFWLSKTRQYFMFTYNLTGLDFCCIYFIYTRFKTNIHVHLHVSIILHTYIKMFVHLNMQQNSFTSYQIFYLMKLLAILLDNL